MKRIFIYFLFLIASLPAFSQGEWVSASIDNGTTPNSTGLYIRTVLEVDANKVDNIVFTVRVPISAGPAVTVTESFKDPSINHITFSIQKLNVDDGAYYYYLVNGTGTVLPTTGTIYPINTAIKLLELTYAGGTTNGVVQLANIENDIPGNIYLRPQFYFQINLGDITNYTTMFFGRGTAVAVNNQPPNGDDFVGTPASVILPVKFLSFNAVKKADNAELNWTVQNETSITNYYQVERSFNGLNFEKFAVIPARNAGIASTTYSTIDQNLSKMRSSGTIYYRVRQFDRDGASVTTEVRAVNLNGRAFDISVYPNPVTTTATLNIDMPEAAKTNIILVDANGKEVQHALLNAAKGLNIYSLNMEKLAAGTYVIRVINGNESLSLPVVKKK